MRVGAIERVVSTGPAFRAAILTAIPVATFVGKVANGKMLDTLASACAADDLGYHGMAQLIRDEQLSPRRIFKLFIT